MKMWQSSRASILSGSWLAVDAAAAVDDLKIQSSHSPLRRRPRRSLLFF